MNIPGDNHKDFRFNKFIEYQHKAAPLDPTTLLAYAERERLKTEDCILLCFLHSAVYCEVTAIHLFETIDWRTVTERQLEKFWREHKPNLQFNSSRRYAKNMNWFVPIMMGVMRKTQRDSRGWLLCGIDATYESLRASVETLPYTGHFASGRFMEPLLWMATKRLVEIDLKEPESLPWKIGANETSGLLNVLRFDQAADEYDKTGKINPESLEDQLDRGIDRLHREIFKRYPEQIRLRCAAQGKLCSFRNLFKGRRYGGFHHDRQLENLRKYELAYPASDLWKRLYKIRKQLFVPQLLGEVGGWDGVRKDRNKLWLTKGLTGVEETNCN